MVCLLLVNSIVPDLIIGQRSVEAPQVRVDVRSFVLESSQQFLISERQKAHGAGAWAISGGRPEFREAPEGYAAREAMEETGLKATKVRFLTATDDDMPADNIHYPA